MAFVGIDLGTTTSEIAVYEDGNPRIIPDTQGNEIVDSYFGFLPKRRELKVGEKVRSIFESEPNHCFEQVKRRMGDDVMLEVGPEKYRPEEISAHILRHLKRAAEADLNEEVSRAVITVPANFPDAARRATRQAGEIAGFEVERIINEPTAAALAYGFDDDIIEENILVYDLGGGTFDVSVVEYMGNALDVLASSGDPHLGGKDFDEALLEHVAEKFKEEHGVTVKPRSGNYYRLLFACEQAKKELSFNHSTSVHIPFFTVKDGEPLTLDVEVTRAEFESLVGPMIDRTKEAIEKALGDADLATGDISRVILIGGSTRIPYVRNLVEDMLGIEPLSSIDPDRAVALGAAAQAAIIDGDSDQIIMDVCPLSLGTTVLEQGPGGAVRPGRYTEIVPPNTKQLKPHTKTFSTLYDDQEYIDFRVYQRESMSDSSQAEVEGEPNEEEGFTLLDKEQIDVPPGEAPQRVEATYTYNQDGMIDIEIEFPATGEKTEFKVETNLDEEAIEASRTKIEKAWKESDYYEDVQALLHQAHKEINEGLDPEKEEQLTELIESIKQALAVNDKDRVKELEEEITNVLFELDF